MKIFKKRVLALAIDTILLSLFVVGMQQLLLNLSLARSGSVILLLIPFIFRDLVFRNASIGKKILGLAVYDKNWRKPKCGVLILRSFSSMTIEYGILMYKSKPFKRGIISIFDWEREKLGTRVIDKKIFKELESKAKNQSGYFEDNMTELYNEYLRSLYLY